MSRAGEKARESGERAEYPTRSGQNDDRAKQSARRCQVKGLRGEQAGHEASGPKRNRVEARPLDPGPKEFTYRQVGKDRDRDEERQFDEAVEKAPESVRGLRRRTRSRVRHERENRHDDRVHETKNECQADVREPALPNAHSGARSA